MARLRCQIEMPRLTISLNPISPSPEYRFVFGFQFSVQCRFGERPMLIVNANLVDVAAGAVREKAAVLIRDGRIEATGRSLPNTGENEIDAAGAYVCPGLIDGHVHLFLNAGSSPRTAFLSSDDEALMRTAETNAALALRSGITTVRDCGGPAQLVFRFAEMVRRGELPGPRILAAGSPLTRPKGHCHFFGVEVASPEDARRAVDRQVAMGAALIKLMASGGGLTPGTDPAEADLPPAVMREAVAAAHSSGVQVCAHCHAAESISRALDAGVDTIEHASFVRPKGPPEFQPELARRMKDQGVAVGPTAISGVRIAQAIRNGGLQNGRDRDAVLRLESRRRHTAYFLEAGVNILAGSDCGVANTPFNSLVDELDEYVNAGMSPVAALRSATSDSARYLNQPWLGSIEAGFAADLLFLSGNPLNSLEPLRAPLVVIKEGVVTCDFRPASLGLSQPLR